MIFAAGLGTRLKPITDTLPKALVPVCGRPLIEHVSRKLMASGIDEAVVNVHHFADKIEAWVGEQDWICTDCHDKSEGRMLVQISDERNMLLETGGAVLHARKYLEGCGHFPVSQGQRDASVIHILRGFIICISQMRKEDLCCA